jgi:hypothetical protein
MGRIVNREVQQLIERTARLDVHGAEGLEEARQGFVEVLAEAKRLGLRSAWLLWRQAIVLDQSRSPELALPFIDEAIALDPLVPPFHESRTIIVRNLRRKLLGCEVPEELRELYAVLQQSSEADEECHLAMAKTSAEGGMVEEALRILEALTVLSPACSEGWAELRAAVLTPEHGPQQLTNSVATA